MTFNFRLTTSCLFAKAIPSASPHSIRTYLRSRHITGAIWGFYEHVAGMTTIDELGALNLLTEQRILNASRTEIQLGKVCSLNWAMHKPSPTPFTRKGLEHKITKWPGRSFINDDEIAVNTQSSSQWDGFRHFGLPSGEIRMWFKFKFITS